MGEDLISVAEAREIIKAHIRRLAPVKYPLEKSLRLILAEDVFASFDIPAFEQSSMDGYAFRWEDRNMFLKIVGESSAGENRIQSITAGETMRIFTGAPLPDGADTIAIQEKVIVNGNQLQLSEIPTHKGIFVRHTGAEIRQGETAIPANNILTPASLGFLAGIGIEQVRVYPPPSVSVIITGNELQKPGKPLARGQVYESNSFGLKAILNNLFITDIHIEKTADNLSQITAALQNALSRSDLIILTGGVSVGDYDFVLKAATDCGVQKNFHKVRQKPGKPIFFGSRENKIVFGLPGNPASVLTCCYQYVIPAIRGMKGEVFSKRKQKAILSAAVNKPAGLTHFLKATYSEGKLTILDGQESFRLASFARANAIVELDAARTEFRAGEEVSFLLIGNEYL